jgi:hypothetical protein
MKVSLIKTKEKRPSKHPEGSEFRGELQVIRYFNTDDKRIGPFGAEYSRKEVKYLTSIVQIEEGDMVLLMTHIQTQPIIEILEVSELDITFRTKTAEYVLRLV